MDNVTPITVAVRQGVDPQGLEDMAKGLGMEVGTQGNVTVLRSRRKAPCSCGGNCGRFCAANDDGPDSAA